MVRVAMEEKGLSYESNLIKLCDHYPKGENLSPEYLAINPKGVVPSIDLDGEIVTESTDIIKRLNTLTGKKDIDLWPQVNIFFTSQCIQSFDNVRAFCDNLTI